MALDVGKKRIGVAVSDPTGLLASPFETIKSTSDPDDVDSVLRIVAEQEVGEIVVGIPLSLSGRAGPQAKRVSEFARALRGRTSVPVGFMDERYSTTEAEKRLREAGGRRSKEKGRVDAAAAAIVLQAYLDSRRETPPLPPLRAAAERGEGKKS